MIAEMNTPEAVALLTRDRRGRHDPLPELTRKEKEERAAREIADYERVQAIKEGRSDPARIPNPITAPSAPGTTKAHFDLELTADEVAMIMQHREWKASSAKEAQTAPRQQEAQQPTQPEASQPRPEPVTKSAPKTTPSAGLDVTALQEAAKGVEFPTDSEPLKIVASPEPVQAPPAPQPDGVVTGGRSRR